MRFDFNINQQPMPVHALKLINVGVNCAYIIHAVTPRQQEPSSYLGQHASLILIEDRERYHYPGTIHTIGQTDDNCQFRIQAPWASLSPRRSQIHYQTTAKSLLQNCLASLTIPIELAFDDWEIDEIIQYQQTNDELFRQLMAQWQLDARYNASSTTLHIEKTHKNTLKLKPSHCLSTFLQLKGQGVIRCRLRAFQSFNQIDISALHSPACKTQWPIAQVDYHLMPNRYCELTLGARPPAPSTTQPTSFMVRVVGTPNNQGAYPVCYDFDPATTVLRQRIAPFAHPTHRIECPLQPNTRAWCIHLGTQAYLLGALDSNALEGFHFHYEASMEFNASTIELSINHQAIHLSKHEMTCISQEQCLFRGLMLVIDNPINKLFVRGDLWSVTETSELNANQLTLKSPYIFWQADNVVYESVQSELCAHQCQWQFKQLTLDCHELHWQAPSTIEIQTERGSLSCANFHCQCGEYSITFNQEGVWIQAETINMDAALTLWGCQSIDTKTLPRLQTQRHELATPNAAAINSLNISALDTAL